MADGRVRNYGGRYEYDLIPVMEYFITDQQGNTRISFEDNNGTASLIQENSYYAFGMQMTGGYTPATNPNKKLYNAGSEWQDDIDGLADYYSTFLREYDPVIGRFNGVDPMSASFESWTSYHYSYNNPVNFNDPMGDLPQIQTATTDRGRFFEMMLKALAEGNTPAGMGNYSATYSGDDEQGNGGGGSMEFLNLDDPVSTAVLGLHTEWGVSMTSLGGQGGFNTVAQNVISGGGATMNFKGDGFKDLTAGETVRQQVKSDNFDDALKTVLSAYKDVINFSSSSYSLTIMPWADGGGFHETTSAGFNIGITFDKRLFRQFATGGSSFGLLVRGVYHEYIHAWDYAGINPTNPYVNKISGKKEKNELELRAHYLMANNNVRLPEMNAKEQHFYWNMIYQYWTKFDGIRNYFNDVMARPDVSPNNKATYSQWNQQIQKFLKKK